MISSNGIMDLAEKYAFYLAYLLVLARVVLHAALRLACLHSIHQTRHRDDRQVSAGSSKTTSNHGSVDAQTAGADPSMSFADITRGVASQWNKLSDEEKKPWKVQ